MKEVGRTSWARLCVCRVNSTHNTPPPPSWRLLGGRFGSPLTSLAGRESERGRGAWPLFGSDGKGWDQKISPAQAYPTVLIPFWDEQTALPKIILEPSFSSFFLTQAHVFIRQVSTEGDPSQMIPSSLQFCFVSFFFGFRRTLFVEWFLGVGSQNRNTLLNNTTRANIDFAPKYQATDPKIMDVALHTRSQ